MTVGRPGTLHIAHDCMRPHLGTSAVQNAEALARQQIWLVEQACYASNMLVLRASMLLTVRIKLYYCVLLLYSLHCLCGLTAR